MMLGISAGRHNAFYAESGGGVTFSGGEPYLHPQYLRQLARACRQLGISTCTESCGCFDFAECSDIIAEMDELFFDIKVMDPARHLKYTGRDNAEILHNIAQASMLNNNIVVRVPVIHDVNDDEKNMRLMCAFLREKTSIRRVELLSYHKLGVEKMTALGLPAVVFQTPSDERLRRLREIIGSYGLENVSYK